MKKVEKALFWCAVMGFIVLGFWTAMLFFAGSWVYSFHSQLWHMDQLFSKEFFLTANLIGIGMWKMAVILFFVIPWLAVKFAIRN